ncbi:hypothetical protein WR25_17995 [Diploscapter pachys]|uniref:Uncharacterized protein n=1 Tax=Diploscapter pachys TaxID=2018661 RepID=A0A2A2JGB4_9BILA|nr:hypothetical protein WR25_17995 [Diploscapter pachys]
MMNFAILLLLSKWSNACLTTPDMDLPPVQPTTEPVNVEWAYNSIWSRFFDKLAITLFLYDGVHIDTYNHVHVHIDVHINTYNHLHVHVHINVYNNYIKHHNNNYNYT